MKASVLYGSKKISFSIEYSARKSLGITVTPDMDVKVKSPVDISLEKIKERIIKRAPWIIKQQSFFLTFYPKTPLRKYISGETHLYLGKQYRLKIILDKSESVRLKGGFIEVCTLKKDKTEKLLNEWYVENARLKFERIAMPIIEKFKKYDVKPQSIVLRSMPTRWGSCTPKGKVILNPELIKAPKGCIEYVIVHELCHLVHHDHTQRFLDLQSKELKDWKKWKNKLEALMA
jgi:predicted metal-dependent hydrolase